jgi:serine/threonine protein kinase
MLDAQGRAILMDFGIVKIVDDQTHTATGAVVGTARYMSPEVIRSERPDERSDIYSLGVTLFEMLGGSPPFNAESAMSLLMRHLNDPVPDVRDLRPDIPAEVVAVINKSLEKDRNHRYRSAEEMAGDLRRILSGLEVERVSSGAPVSATGLPADEPATEVISPAAPDNATEPVMVTAAAYTPLNDDSDPATLVEEDATVSDMDMTLPETPEQAEPAVAASPVVLPEEPRPAVKTSLSPMLLFAGGGIALLLILVAGWYLFRNGLTASPIPTATETPTHTPSPTSTEAAILLVNTDVPTSTMTPTITPTATQTLPPLYVRINNITIRDDRYVVEYETFGYTEILPGQHVHFFFNTVPPELAGSPATSPWFVYGGPRPFDGYRLSNRPAAATQMCALVANPNHTIILESGNCLDLP